jgi:anti-sigma B factor antagonist
MVGGHVRAQTIEIQIHPPTTCLVRLHGEHDVATGDAVAAALAAAAGHNHVVVDLAHCTFIDSTLITRLLGAAKRMRERGGTLELVVPEEANAVRRTLELANVQMVLPFHASFAAALASIAAVGRPSCSAA